MSQHQQGLQDGHDGPEDDAGADVGVGGGQEVTVAGQLDAGGTDRVGPGAGDGVVPGLETLNRPEESPEEVDGQSRPGLRLRPGGALVLIPGLEEGPRHHLHHEGLQTEALPGYQDGDEDAEPLVYEVRLHDVDPSQQVVKCLVVGARAAEREESAQPLLGERTALGRQLTAEDGEVVERLRVELVVDDGGEDVHHQTLLVLLSFVHQHP